MAISIVILLAESVLGHPRRQVDRCKKQRKEMAGKAAMAFLVVDSSVSLAFFAGELTACLLWIKYHAA